MPTEIIRKLTALLNDGITSEIKVVPSASTASQ